MGAARDPFFYNEEAVAKGLPPLSPAPKSPPNLLRFASDNLSRATSLSEAEHFLHNHHASVASLRLLFTFAPERRSASLRNRCSPSPEYPVLSLPESNPLSNPSDWGLTRIIARLGGSLRWRKMMGFDTVGIASGSSLSEKFPVKPTRHDYDHSTRNPQCNPQ